MIYLHIFKYLTILIFLYFSVKVTWLTTQQSYSALIKRSLLWPQLLLFSIYYFHIYLQYFKHFEVLQL